MQTVKPRATARAKAVQDTRLAALTRLFPLAVLLILLGTLIARAEGDTTISHGYSNFGSLRYGPDLRHLDYVNPDAPKGGEISIATQGTFDSFNPYSRKGVAAALASVGSESLLISTADDAYGVYCYLCTTMEYPETLDWIIFTLRDDVTFADGTAMTAEDVAFSFNLFLEQGIVEYRSIFEGFIANVEVLDAQRIRFTFTDDAPIRERVSFAGGTPVFSKAWFETTGTRLDESTDQAFMATGPYVLDNYDINRQIVYRRNPDFWGAEHPLNIGRNNFDSIRIEYFSDDSAAFEGFKAGEYTYRVENSSKDWATGYDFQGVDNGWVKREEVPDQGVGSAQSFVFNLDRANWQDPRVREAIRLMFNFEWSNEKLFYGLYTRVNSFWPGSLLQANGAPSEGEVAILQPLVDDGALPASLLTADAVTAPVLEAGENRPSRGTYRQASALLADAGWVIGDDGLRRKDGEVLKLVFLSFSPLFDRIINPYIENLQQLGIDASLDRVDNAQYVERRRSGDFDLTNHSFSMGFEPGTELEQWYASKTADDSSRNVMRLRNDAVDRLMPVVAAAKTLDELETAVHALDRVLRHLGFTVPQWYKDRHTVAYFDMFEHPENMPPYDLGYLDFWWYNADKAEALKAAGALR